MESVTAVLAANEGLVVALALIVLFPVGLAVPALVMRAAGASLRPVLFVAGLALPLVVSFSLAQLALARVPAPPGAGGLAVTDGGFADRARIFGPGIPEELIRPAAPLLPGILDGAEAAEAGVSMTGETVLAAQFPEAGQARQAAAAYHSAFALRDTGGSEEDGWTAKRAQGDHLEMLLRGRTLLVWTGATPEDAAARRAATNVDALLPEAGGSGGEPLFPALQPLVAFFAPTGMKLLGASALVALYLLWFFRGASWASGRSEPRGGAAVPATELEDRLLALNEARLPFSVTRGAEPGVLLAEWRHGDAVWADTARARGLRRTFRIRLSLDERRRVVRASDYAAAFDWSAGRGGADLEWKFIAGLVFFQQQRDITGGVRLDGEGRADQLIHTVDRLDLGQMKGALSAVVMLSGWSWRPVAWQAPVWLRWLTG